MNFSSRVSDAAFLLVKDEFSHLRKRWTIPFFVAWLLFVVSMLVPAVSSITGWECAWLIMEGLPRVHEMENAGDYFLLSLNFSNLAMILSPLAVAFSSPGHRRDRWIIPLLILCTGLVLAFSVFAEAKWEFNLEAGYFLWAASFVILTGEWMRQSFIRRLENA